MAFPKKSVLLLSLPLVLFISIFLYNSLPSLGIMELRNFIAAREILEDGSWLLPTLNGEIRIAKPPLPTWITAAAMELAGTDLSLAVDRTPSGICALLFVMFTFLLARRISSTSGYALTTILMLSTSYLFISSARENEWGIYACTAMAGALWALTEALRREGQNHAFFLLFSLLMAGSFLSKGPVAFWTMLLPFLICYGMVYGTKEMRHRKLGIFWSVLLCILLSAMWPAYVYLNTPHAAAVIASRESGAWFARHREPFWYYLTHLPVIGTLWTPFLLYGLIVPFLSKDRSQEERFTVYWFFLTILFLSVFPEKKQRYLFPALLPGTMVSSMALYRLGESGKRAWNIVYGSFSLTAGILFLSASGFLVYLYLFKGTIWALPGAPLLACTGAYIIYGFFSRRSGHMFMTAIVGICLCFVFIFPLSGQPDQNDIRGFVKLRENPALQGRHLYSVGDLRLKYIWAAGRVITPVPEEKIMDLRGKGTGNVLVSPRKLDPAVGWLQFRGTIDAGERYYLYLIN